MGFFDWYLKCIKNHYADLDGRARRTEYWMFYLVNLIIVIVLALISRAMGSQVLSTLYGLAVLVPHIAVAVRRLHDTGRTGWWLLIALIPVIGWIWIIVLLATNGDQGSNQYGADPKEGVA
ncbi:DUF805 domain-containing protein [Rhodanobacter sp. C01]|uniref:DUF805 domain-containing protein n=1 Tax=Rhodanobacter sp. C01 TaxID=1945856 RepID=UPI0009872FFE|nr:DUF805 domain-containing protein [Rhodanobacter sp. C01]OOG45738.1 hypothetical protein B0E50_16335 [Rhodanobacter sp. C01]